MIPEYTKKLALEKINKSNIRTRRDVSVKLIIAAIIGQFNGFEFTSDDVRDVYVGLNREIDRKDVAKILRELEKENLLSMRKVLTGGRDSNRNIYKCIV